MKTKTCDKILLAVYLLFVALMGVFTFDKVLKQEYLIAVIFFFLVVLWMMNVYYLVNNMTSGAKIEQWKEFNEMLVEMRKKK